MVRVLIPALKGFPGLGINGRQVVLTDGTGEFDEAELDVLLERFHGVTVLDAEPTPPTEKAEESDVAADSADADESDPAKRRSQGKRR